MSEQGMQSNQSRTKRSLCQNGPYKTQTVFTIIDLKNKME